MAPSTASTFAKASVDQVHTQTRRSLGVGGSWSPSPTFRAGEDYFSDRNTNFFDSVKLKIMPKSVPAIWAT